MPTDQHAVAYWQCRLAAVQLSAHHGGADSSFAIVAGAHQSAVGNSKPYRARSVALRTMPPARRDDHADVRPLDTAPDQR